MQNHKQRIRMKFLPRVIRRLRLVFEQSSRRSWCRCRWWSCPFLQPIPNRTENPISPAYCHREL